MQDSQNSKADVFNWQGLQIDPVSGQVKGQAGQVRLEPKVMALLLKLAGNPGTLVSRAELLREIWPGDGVYDEALTQCIYQLRMQLCEAGGSDAFRTLVKTVPKRGYILVGEVSRPEPNPSQGGVKPAGQVVSNADEPRRPGLLQKNLAIALLALVMVLGYGIIAVPTGIVTAEIARARPREVSTQACATCGLEGHDHDARFCKHCGAGLSGLTADRGTSRLPPR